MKDLLSIKEFAVLCRTTPRTIRFYDLQGLLKPVFVDPQSKYRYYSPYQAREFFRLRLLQEFHVPLKKIQEALPNVTKENFLDGQMQTLKREIEERQKEYDFLQNIRAFLFSGESAKAKLVDSVVGPYVLLKIQVLKGRYDSINTHITELTEMAKTRNISITGKQMVFYLDAVTYKPKDTRLEIALITTYKDIPTNIELPQGHSFVLFPETKVKMYTYKGPYEYITLIYQKLFSLESGSSFAREDGKEVREIDPSEVGFDIQENGPWWPSTTTSPYDFVTKICFPLSSV